MCNTLHYLFCRNVQYFTLFNFIDGKRHKKAGTAVAIPAQIQTHNNIFKHARKHPHGLYVIYNL